MTLNVWPWAYTSSHACTLNHNSVCLWVYSKCVLRVFRIVSKDDNFCRLCRMDAYEGHMSLLLFFLLALCLMWVLDLPSSLHFYWFRREIEGGRKKGPFQDEVKWSSSGWRVAFSTYWRGGKMSLLWKPFQETASWLDECPGVRQERIPCATKQVCIKGQRMQLNTYRCLFAGRRVY